MIEQFYENLKLSENPRKELISIKQELKEPSAVLRLRSIINGEYEIFLKFLKHEDAKVRKNTALILGMLQADEAVDALYATYEEESQRFVKSSYLTALENLNYDRYLSKLEQRLKELENYQPQENEEKHVREEITALRRLLSKQRSSTHHRFRGYSQSYEVILTTDRQYQELTDRQIKQGKVLRLKNGVRVKTNHIEELLTIPTYKELLFLLNVRTLQPEPDEAAYALAVSDLLELLEKAHTAKDTYRFRLGIYGKMPLDKRGEFAKRLAFSLEQKTRHQLENSMSDYEVEIRLMEKSDGTFLPLVKLYTLPDKRFYYRKNTVAASIRPERAAVIAELCRPYMKKEAQILDPFCGVGTMLLERSRICPARVMYGIDIFGKAIQGARENTALANQKIYYINKDFFEFSHEYLFDEIITDMPVRGKKSREEHDRFYERFFVKALEVLNDKGRIFLYSDEKNFIKKQLRVRTEFSLLQEYSMDEKDRYSLFIIEKRG